jgi:putative DNA methylase
MTLTKIVAPKKLIEVALPLDDINKAAAREKSLRHGHPSTLHLWWARRPLAAARAVLFAQLVNDPSWKYTEDELKKPQVKSVITRKRNELFRIISQIVQWENPTSNDALLLARAEIRASWRETCEANKSHPDAKVLFDPEKLPPAHDPFAGGGTIPLEAQRLGLTAHATDLNPVSVLINKATIEIPPKFAGCPPVAPVPAGRKQTNAKATEEWPGTKGLAEDVRRYGKWMWDEAATRIGHLYPKVKITKAMVKERKDLAPYEGQDLTVIAWLWARTVKSPNPAYAEIDVPLAATFMLSLKEGRETFAKPVITGSTYAFKVGVGSSSEDVKHGTKLGRASFRCLLSGSPISADYIRGEAQGGRMGVRLMAVVAEGERSRVYISPTREMEETALKATPHWKPDIEFFQAALGFRVGNYGLTKWSDLFTARQTVALATLCDLVNATREQVRRDAAAAHMPDDGRGLDAGGVGGTAYADAIAVYLGLAIGKLADNASAQCSWHNGSQHQKIRATYSRQALPIAWDFAEGNPFSDSSGNFFRQIELIAEVVDALPRNVAPGDAVQADAATQSTSRGCVVSTDPPYYDNIGYADLSDFFYVWLRRALKPVLPDLFATLTVPKAEELVATPARHGGKQAAEAFFLAGMTRAMSRIAEQSELTTPITIYYAFKQSETEDGTTSSTGWETFLEAVIRAGLAIVGTWPMRTELANRMRGTGSNALASSIVLVCRTRPSGAASTARKDFLRELDRAMPAAIAEMTADPMASIAPVDLAQACIGPGMAIFSKYDAVLEASGSAMGVQSALVHINKSIDEYFEHAEGDLDADTRFCIGWFDQFGFEAGEFGKADVLARAKGTSVDGVRDAGVVEAGKGKVRLLSITNLPKKWDPATDTRAPIWEALHHMCKALGESESAAGALLARMPAKQDAIRQLAYRLYTLCAERKKQAELGRPYNDLITSWPAIVEASQKAPPVNKQIGLL